MVDILQNHLKLSFLWFIHFNGQWLNHFNGPWFTHFNWIIRAFEIMELQDRVKSSGSVPVFDGMGQNWPVEKWAVMKCFGKMTTRGMLLGKNINWLPFPPIPRSKHFDTTAALKIKIKMTKAKVQQVRSAAAELLRSLYRERELTQKQNIILYVEIHKSRTS